MRLNLIPCRLGFVAIVVASSPVAVTAQSLNSQVTVDQLAPVSRNDDNRAYLLDSGTINPDTGIGKYSAGATAWTEYGANHAVATVRTTSNFGVTAESMAYSYSAQASSSYSDTITFSSPNPALLGQNGFCIYQFAVTGSATTGGSELYNGSEEASAFLTLQFSDDFLEFVSPELIADETLQSHMHGFTFGSALDFSVTLAAHASVVGPDVTQSASADFEDTARLVGIGVFDAFGNALTNVTITSASGTNYAVIKIDPHETPIPEPGVFAMASALALSGAGFFLRSARKRRRYGQKA